MADVVANTPADSPLTLADVMASPLYMDLVTPMMATGDRAIDFELPRLEAPEETVRLSSFADQRPVALIFGSFT